jgi:hypothetical protein
MVTGACINCENCVKVKFPRYAMEFGCDAITNRFHSIDIIQDPYSEIGECKAYIKVNDIRHYTVDFAKEKRIVTYEKV